MLTFDCFNKCISVITTLHSVKVDPVMHKMLYELLKTDFDDIFFKEVCFDIAKQENLYGKYPTPKMFYDRKEKKEKNIFVEVGAFFVDKTMPEYYPLLKHLPNDVADPLCERVWKWLIKNKRGEYVSEQFVKDLIVKFSGFWNVVDEEQIEDTRVKGLLEVAIKKI